MSANKSLTFCSFALQVFGYNKATYPVAACVLCSDPWELAILAAAPSASLSWVAAATEALACRLELTWFWSASAEGSNAWWPGMICCGADTDRCLLLSKRSLLLPYSTVGTVPGAEARAPAGAATKAAGATVAASTELCMVVAGAVPIGTSCTMRTGVMNQCHLKVLFSSLKSVMHSGAAVPCVIACWNVACLHVQSCVSNTVAGCAGTCAPQLHQPHLPI